MTTDSLSQFTDAFINTLIEDLEANDREEGNERDLELSQETHNDIARMCKEFFIANEEQIHVVEGRGCSGVQEAGYLFYMTIVGHGVGFWDNTIMSNEDIGIHLDNASKSYSLDAYIGDDGLIYN